MSGARNIFVLMGPPGSGKGSVAGLCAEKLGCVQLSTGNLCRKHISEKTKIGREIDFAIKSGKLIADDLVIQMVADWFEQQIRQDVVVLLDGFPRTLAQAEKFDAIIKKKFDSISLRIIQFCLTEEMVVYRLSKRLICKNNDCQAVYSVAEKSSSMPRNLQECDRCNTALTRRSDDDEEAIKRRLIIYKKHADQLLDFYRNSGYLIHSLDVEKSLQDVFHDFKKLIQS